MGYLTFLHFLILHILLYSLVTQSWCCWIQRGNQSWDNQCWEWHIWTFVGDYRNPSQANLLKESNMVTQSLRLPDILIFSNSAHLALLSGYTELVLLGPERKPELRQPVLRMTYLNIWWWLPQSFTKGVQTPWNNVQFSPTASTSNEMSCSGLS